MTSLTSAMRSLPARLAGRVLLAVVLIICGMAGAVAQPPDEIRNPNLGNIQDFVADPYDQLSRATESHINDRLVELRKTTTCELAVAIIHTTGDLSIEDYAYTLFRRWGLGRADNNNGVLLVVATDDRTARIEVGSGAEGALPDITCGKIMRDAITPALKDGSINQAVSNGVDMIYEVLTQPEVAEELRSAHTDSAADRIRAIDGDTIWNFLWVTAVCVFLFTLVMFFIDLFASRKHDHYRRAMIWRAHLQTYWWGAVLSCGLALPLALIAWWLYRHLRDVPEICDSCGAKMRKLPEDEDNAYLSPSQDLEEKLGTVDYDVWLCPECGTVERFPYVEHQLKYRKCPDCGTVAMGLVMDKVVQPATTQRAGHGERIYQCQFCRKTHREGYVIPKKVDAAAAAITAAAIGAAMSRGGGGGGNGGGPTPGGFGGGHSSGGGATGRW
ncbi:MAG: TPM domain-containing protein [Muribaculaceae bacterium]|nr:TPM domain-containing protein [Muribaculaceae bacterium]